MTPEEKKNELIEKFQSFKQTAKFACKKRSCIEVGCMSYEDSTKAAIIAVEEILDLPVFWYDKELIKDEPGLNIGTIELWTELLTLLKK